MFCAHGHLGNNENCTGSNGVLPYWRLQSFRFLIDSRFLVITVNVVYDCSETPIEGFCGTSQHTYERTELFLSHDDSAHGT